MKAIILQGEPGKVSLITDRPYPKLRSGYLLVDVKAVALNPADWKHVDFMNNKGALFGCDFAGVVVETGTGYSKQWEKDDRICGFVHGGNKYQHEDGAFAERIAVKADIAMRIPDTMSYEDAATLGVGVITCGQGLFQEMKLNLPGRHSTKGEVILIYGGSSATGTLGIQFAKLAGYTPITTCSSRNFDLVKSLGAAAAFDYKDPDCVEQIKQFTGGELTYIWDTISLSESAEICSKVISPGGTYGTVLYVNFPRSDITQTFSLGYTAMGEPIDKGGHLFEARPQDFEFTKKWVTEAELIISQGQLKAHPKEVYSGLEKVIDGLDLLRHNRVSGKKLVYVL